MYEYARKQKSNNDWQQGLLGENGFRFHEFASQMYRSMLRYGDVMLSMRTVQARALYISTKSLYKKHTSRD